MNSFLSKKIDKEIPNMPDGFSAAQMKDRMVDKMKTLRYLENTTTIGSYLSRHSKLITIVDDRNKRTYWRTEHEN
tara:strand:- start:612 stop:836 length:225 start_codon:yes stop_codon:yes gene_type:complete